MLQNDLNSCIILVPLKLLVPLKNQKKLHCTEPQRHLLHRLVVSWSGGQSFYQPILLLLTDTDKSRGGGYKERGKQASHKRSCSNIPIQATDFHIAVQPNIGINEVYQVTWLFRSFRFEPPNVLLIKEKSLQLHNNGIIVYYHYVSSF